MTGELFFTEPIFFNPVIPTVAREGEYSRGGYASVRI